MKECKAIEPETENIISLGKRDLIIMKKIVVQNTGNVKDAVLYSNPIEYWNPKEKSYLVWAGRSRSTVWHDVDYYAMMDGSYTDMGRLLRLMSATDQDNCIYCYDKHTKARKAVTELSEIQDLLELSTRSWRRFYKTLKDKNILREMTIKGKDAEYRHYFVSPLVTMGSKRITLTVYKLFQPELDKILPARAIDDLQRHWREESGENEACVDVETVDAETVQIPEPVPVIESPAPETIEPELTEAEKIDVYQQYVLGGKDPQIYQLRNNGMFAAPNPDLNHDCWLTPNRIPDTEYRDGRKKVRGEEITELCNWFLDIDAGRDADGNYYTLEEVARRKKTMMQVIAMLPEPTAIIDTRNGYHVYWSCFGVKSRDEWQEVENKLIEAVTISDAHARDVARLLRVPYTMHLKDRANPYMITIKQAARNQYPAADLIALLDARAPEIAAACNAYTIKYGTERKSYTQKQGATKKQSIAATIDKPYNINIHCIKALEVPPAFDNGAMVMPMDASAIIPYIRKHVLLTDLLDLPANTAFRCILPEHEDRNPSASIYHNADHDRYVCSCNRRGYDVIDIVRKLSGCSTTEAITYLKKVAHVTALNVVRGGASAKKSVEELKSRINKKKYKEI